MSLKNKVILYLGRTPDFLEEVKLQDDGSGPYIKEWNISSEKSKPTDSQLDALASEATKLGNNNVIRNTRRLAYGDIGEQLDLLYKDIVANKLDTTGEWAKKIKAIKDDNPKE
tara:strand:- start:637 stop:975 length:339 start_codon:yes stop_codon:yes gene_type:complete